MFAFKLPEKPSNVQPKVLVNARLLEKLEVMVRNRPVQPMGGPCELHRTRMMLLGGIFFCGYSTKDTDVDD